MQVCRPRRGPALRRPRTRMFSPGATLSVRFTALQERGSAGLGAPGRVPDPGCVFGLPQGTVELRMRKRSPPPARGRGPRRSPGDRGRDGHAAFSSAGVTRALTNEEARGWHARSVCLRPGAGRLRKCTWTYFSNLGPRTSGPLPALVQNPWRTCFLGG